MKRFVKCICLFLVLVMALTTTAFAAESVMPRASNYFMRYTAYLYQVTSTKFEVWFSVSAVEGMDELGVRTLKVQRSSDGTDWTTMKTFTREDYPELICEDTSMHSTCVSYTGTRGYYYRAYVEFYAKNSSGTGIYTYYTAAIQLPKS